MDLIGDKIFLGQTIEPAVARPLRSGPPPFSVGDKVKVVVSEEELRAMQQGHGGWNPKMAEVRLPIQLYDLLFNYYFFSILVRLVKFIE